MKTNDARRNREKAEMRLRVLDAARELFVNGGEEAVTLRTVAERIEYSATTIYLHFENKEALIHELCTTDFAAYARALQQAQRIIDPLARLRKVATTYVDFGLLYPAHYRAMFMTPAGRRASAASKDDALSAAKRPADPPSPAEVPTPYDFLHTAIFKAMAAGSFDPRYREVAAITQLIWSGLHGVISLHLVRARFSAVNWQPVQTAVELMLDCLIVGLTNGRDTQRRQEED